MARGWRRSSPWLPLFRRGLGVKDGVYDGLSMAQRGGQVCFRAPPLAEGAANDVLALAGDGQVGCEGLRERTIGVYRARVSGQELQGALGAAGERNAALDEALGSALHGELANDPPGLLWLAASGGDGQPLGEDDRALDGGRQWKIGPPEARADAGQGRAPEDHGRAAGKEGKGERRARAKKRKRANGNRD